MSELAHQPSLRKRPRINASRKPHWRVNEVPSTVVDLIFTYAITPATQRLISRGHRDGINRSMIKITIRPKAPASVIQIIIRSRPRATCLILDHCKDATDQAIQLIPKYMPCLTNLSIAFCSGVSIRAFANINPQMMVRPRGCWPIVSPSPALSPVDVIEIQLLALKENEPGKANGVQAAGKFWKASAHNCKSLSEQDLSEGLRSILNCKEFHIRCLGTQAISSSLRRCFAHVRVSTEAGHVQHFLWNLVNEGNSGAFPGCWLVQAVRSICPAATAAPVGEGGSV
mmetsp:Transcript_19875/g.30106  ORF Transcript_19875/g.30106 Transcript_19875/m.30106 type:complete len:285 (+) Transcript_19875:35-889(+)